MAKKGVPRYRWQKKPSGDLSFVEVSGTRRYLGHYGSPESRTAYARFLAEWEANGCRFAVPEEEITVVELLARFWEHAEEYYRRPDGTPTGAAEAFKHALRHVKEIYGDLPAARFGPRELKVVRSRLLGEDLARTYVNQNVNRIRHVFKWGVAEGLIPPMMYVALQAVSGLRRGRTRAREPEAVKPVERERIDAVRLHVSRHVWAMIQLQLLTAARSGEIVLMRPRDLDTSGTVWLYTPESHKTEHHGHRRTIYLGPRAQTIVHPFLLGRPHDAFIFSPIEAEAERRAELRARRVTPAGRGNEPGTNRVARPERKPGERWTTKTYYRAIARACELAKVTGWHPHQLRHNAATELRRQFGIEAARIILGHRSPLVTEIYAEADKTRALKVIQSIG